MSDIGVIKEQGDLGLFFDPLTDKEEQVLKEQQAQKDQDQKDKN